MKIFRQIALFLGIIGLGSLLSGCGMISNVSPGDGSISLLTSLFGSPLQGSLSGSLNTALVFPVLIHAFNTGLMSAALLIFAYIAVVGTIYTAQDGVFLGKKWSKTFIPLRAILGVVLIFPTGASGFCIAQYIIYAMTYTGVGLADYVWKDVAANAGVSGLSPGVPQSVLQGIDAAVGEMVFYNVVSSLTGNSLSAKNPDGLQAGNTSSGSPIRKLFAESSSCTPGGTTVCVSSTIPMTKGFMNSLGYNGKDDTSNILLNAITSTTAKPPCNDNGDGYCAEINTLIWANIANQQIPDNEMIGNLQYLLPATGYYVETDMWLNMQGKINSLPPPPKQILPPPSNGLPDPVALAYTLASSLSKTIQSASSAYNSPVTPYVFDRDTLMTGIGPVIAALATYNAAQNPGAALSPENFSDSWWLAGDEYLYLDQVFASEASSLNNAVGQFQSQVAGGTQALIQLTGGGVLTNITELDLTAFPASSTSGYPGNAQVRACGDGTHASSAKVNGCGYFLTPFPTTTTDFMLPLPLKTYLSALATAVTTSPTAWPPNAAMAAYDLLCKLQGTYCSNLVISQGPPPVYYAPYYGQSGVPHALDLTQPPFPPIIQDLFYFFNLETALGVNPSSASYQQAIYELDQALNFAYEAYAVSNSVNPCPANIPSSSVGCNPNAPGWNNPMLVAGANSPLGNVMGFIFSGLVGSKYGANNIAGLLAQVWCVGEVNFGTCVSNIQTGSPSSGSSGSIGVPSSGIVTAHFDVIANAQWVGMNLIGGSVAALTSIYQGFGLKMKSVEDTLSSGTGGGLSTAQWAGMAIPGFGGIVSAAASETLIKQTTQASVDIAAASVSLMWLPVVMIVLTTLFTTGVMFAIFIPMLPFVLFWAGKIAWILLVIEAIFAAPLMALAMAYPEGHDLWGMGEQGFKISLNLLLLPVLMIVGLVSAMAITYFILNMTANGFHYVSESLLSMAAASVQSSSSIIALGSGNSLTIAQTNSLVTQGIMSTFLIFMYASFISLAFNKSFSTIYVIPERVMAWIGSQGMKFGEKEAGEMQQAVSKQADQAAQGGGQAVSQGTQAQKGVAESKVSQTQQEGQAEIQVGSAVGQASTAGVQTAASLMS